MNNRAEKILKLAMAIYLAILFTIVTPNHNHEDHADYSDCVICITGSMPTLEVTSFSLIIIAILLKIRLIFSVPVLVLQTFDSFQSRAPPLFNYPV